MAISFENAEAARPAVWHSQYWGGPIYYLGEKVSPQHHYIRTHFGAASAHEGTVNAVHPEAAAQCENSMYNPC